MDFSEYVAARGPALERFAYVLTGDPHRAQDLVQTALLKAYRRWRWVARADHPDAYVRRIVTTSFLDWRRRRSSTEEPVGELPDRPDGADPGDRVAERDELHRALATLSPRQRAVLVLRHYEGWDDAAIGPRCAARGFRLHPRQPGTAAAAGRPRPGLARRRQRPGRHAPGRTAMTDVHRLLADAFEDLGRHAPHDPDLAGSVRRRARWRTAVAGSALAVLLVAGTSTAVLAGRSGDGTAPPAAGASTAAAPPAATGCPAPETGVLPEWARGGFSDPEAGGVPFVRGAEGDIVVDPLRTAPVAAGAGPRQQDPLGAAGLPARADPAGDRRPAGRHHRGGPPRAAAGAGTVRSGPAEARLLAPAAALGRGDRLAPLRYTSPKAAPTSP